MTRGDGAAGAVTTTGRTRGFFSPLLLVIGLIAAVMTIDGVLVADFTIGVLYVIPIVACLTFASERAVFAILPVLITAEYVALFLGPAPADLRVALFNRTLSVITTIGVAILIVRQIRINHELDAQRRRLAHLLDLNKLLVRAVSHDIRGPVGAMVGLAGLLRDGAAGPISDEQRELLGRVQRSGHGVLALASNLLTAAQLDAEEFPVEAGAFDLAATVREIAEEVAVAGRGEIPSVVVEAPDTLPLRSDSLRVRQIIANLVSNAIKFSPADRTVRVVARSDANWATVAVCDEGPGIAADEQAAVFEMFYRTSAGRHRAGFGIGLPLARRIARLLGGDITLVSTPGEGSTFTLSLPVSPAVDPGVDAAPAARSGPDSPPAATVTRSATPG